MEQVFKDNPNLDVAYKTVDGKYFFLESDAMNHAKTLENRKVKKVTPETKGDVKEAVQEVIAESLTLVNDLQDEAPDEAKEKVSKVEATEEPNEQDEAPDEAKEEVSEVEEAEEPATKPNKKTKTKA